MECRGRARDADVSAEGLGTATEELSVFSHLSQGRVGRICLCREISHPKRTNWSLKVMAEHRELCGWNEPTAIIKKGRRVSAGLAQVRASRVQQYRSNAPTRSREISSADRPSIWKRSSMKTGLPSFSNAIDGELGA
jgi:hypothetical protein